MSQALAGYKATLTVSTESGQAKAKIVELRNYTLRPSHAPINATTHDSSGDREIIAGTGQWTAQADILWVVASTSHQALHDVLAGRIKVDAEFAPTGSTADGTLSGSGFVTDWTMGAPNDDALNAGLSLEGDGALVRNSSA